MPNVGAPVKRAIPFTVTVPAGTLQTAPQTFPLSIPDSWVYEIELQVPDGPGGLMGFYVAYATHPVIPWSETAQYLIVNDYEKSFPVEAQMGKGLTVVAYNLGAWPHEIFVRVISTPISAYNASGYRAPIQPVDFSSSGQGAGNDV